MSDLGQAEASRQASKQYKEFKKAKESYNKLGRGKRLINRIMR